MFTDRQLDGQTDAGEFPRRKKSSSGLQELIMPEPTGGLGGPLVPRPTVKLSTRDAMTRNVYRQLDGQTDAGEFPDRKKSSSGLRPEEIILSKRALPSMSEPTGGLVGSLVPRPRGILSSILTPVPEIITFRSTHIISHAKIFSQSY